MITFGKRFRAIRMATGFSQQAVAAHIGISNVYICLIEKGAHKPAKKLRGRLVKALDVPAKIFEVNDNE